MPQKSSPCTSSTTGSRIGSIGQSLSRDISPRPLVTQLSAGCSLVFAGVRFSSVFEGANTYEHRRTSAESVQVGEHLGEHLEEHLALLRLPGHQVKTSLWVNILLTTPQKSCSPIRRGKRYPQSTEEERNVHESKQFHPKVRP